MATCCLVAVGEGNSRLMKRLISTARKLRQSQTEAEAILWSRLRGRQLLGKKFRRQAPIGDFIADFLCHDAGLVIELDGSQHVDNHRDLERTAAIESAGYIVLRFWNGEVFQNLEGVIERIAQTLDVSGTPDPLTNCD